MNNRRKIFGFFSANVLAFGSIMASIKSQFGMEFFLDIFLPAVIILGSHLGLLISTLAKHGCNEQGIEEQCANNVSTMDKQEIETQERQDRGRFSVLSDPPEDTP